MIYISSNLVLIVNKILRNKLDSNTILIFYMYAGQTTEDLRLPRLSSRRSFGGLTAKRCKTVNTKSMQCFDFI